MEELMDDQFASLQELAEELTRRGIPVSTTRLRRYCHWGLIPNEQSSEGRRVFKISIKALPHIEAVCQLKNLGLTNMQVKEFFEQPDHEKWLRYSIPGYARILQALEVEKTGS